MVLKTYDSKQLVGAHRTQYYPTWSTMRGEIAAKWTTGNLIGVHDSRILTNLQI